MKWGVARSVITMLYCQDNRISWVNWQLSNEDEGLLTFVKQMIRIRRSASAFTELHLKTISISVLEPRPILCIGIILMVVS